MLLLFKKPGRVIIGAIALGVVYLFLVVGLARYAAFPPWYHPAVGQGDKRELPPCSNYQKKAYVYCGNPSSDFNLPHQSFNLSVPINERQVSVSGWLVSPVVDALETPPPRGAVILVHGGGADRRAMLKHVGYLHAAGYASIIIDCHNHGLSENDKRGISFGRYESESVLLAAKWWRATAAGAGKLFVLGTSQGGFSALLAASKAKELFNGVIAEAPYSSVAQALSDVPLLTYIPDAMKKHGLYVLSVWHGVDYSELDIKKFGPDISTPTLVMHGGDDDFIPPSHSQKVVQSIGTNEKDLWIVPYGKHERLWNIAPKEFEYRVLKFLEKYAQAAVVAEPEAGSSSARSIPFQGKLK